MDENFMLGWRLWSFHMTRIGRTAACLMPEDANLIQKMRTRGRLCGIDSKEKWNTFRTSMLEIFLSINPRMHYHDQYRLIFQRVAFVVLDCCFVAKYKCDNIHSLLTNMFRDSTEIPSYFIIINNDILESEIEYKINQEECPQYRNTQQGINRFRRFNPSLVVDKMQKTCAPVTMTHKAMLKAELRAQAKMASGASHHVNRASINDYAQLYLIDQLRRSFGQCARVALLSDDNRMIRTASKFVAPKSRTNVYPNLPNEYIDSYIITPSKLRLEEWEDWKQKNAYYNRLV